MYCICETFCDDGGLEMIDLWDYVLYSSVRKAKNRIKKIQKECDNDLIVIDNDIYHFIEEEEDNQE